MIIAGFPAVSMPESTVKTRDQRGRRNRPEDAKSELIRSVPARVRPGAALAAMSITTAITQ